MNKAGEKKKDKDKEEFFLHEREGL